MTAAPPTPPADSKQAAIGCVTLLVLAGLLWWGFKALQPPPRAPYPEEQLAQMCGSTTSAMDSLAHATSDRLEKDLKTNFTRNEGLRTVLVLMVDGANNLKATNQNVSIDCGKLAEEAYKTVLSHDAPFVFVLNTSKRYPTATWP